ncbi:MAG: hypothetical protein KJ749_06615, partial [Planctomycetes bacterium]|nr:hypothetical protein [Planctomycetota bacterium]
MCRWLITGMVTLVFLLGLPVHAAVLVTFEATDVTMAPVSGPVAAGSWIDVDILLSVDGEEDVSLADIRGLQFEFSETSSSLV